MLKILQNKYKSSTFAALTVVKTIGLRTCGVLIPHGVDWI